MQSVSSRIWTRVAVSISYDDNHYTTGTAIIVVEILFNALKSINSLEKNLNKDDVCYI